MIYRRFTVGRYPINGYLVADPQTRIGAFIDPGGFHEEIAQYISKHNIELRDIFFTHGDWDHIEGLEEFSKRYSLQCYAGKGEVQAASHILHGGETLKVGQLEFQTFSTPGHSPAGISFYCQDRLFPGDALFCGSMGGCESTEKAEQQIEAVRKYLFTLPDTTTIHPGHGPMSTIAAEKYANPFFQ